MATYQ